MLPIRRQCQRILLVAAFILSSVLAPAAAAQPDPGNLGSGSPELFLSGIQVGVSAPGARISSVIRRYGQPASKEDAVVPDGAGGTRFYTWQFPGLKMSVATYFAYKSKRILWWRRRVTAESRVAYIDVWGDAPRGVLGTTGRGLALGTTLEQQKAVYGPHYAVPYVDKSAGITHVEVWWKDETCLMIDYGANGHSNHIRLTSKES
jgi:hypothetical protein